MDPTSQTDQQLEESLHCHRHPQVETALSCARCGKSVCVQCMVQANVGIRCKECGKPVRMPTFDVTPAYYARAVGAGLAVAVGGGLLWSVFNLFFRGIPFLPSLAAMAIGYGVGELISLSVNRKRGNGLGWIAGGSVALAFLISWRILPFGFGFIGLLFLGIGVYMAVQRVR
jgi:DNA-directed RNA polymerase subunit RPC12/RpoP